LKFNRVAYHIAFWLLAYLFWIFVFRNGTLVLTHAITIQFCYLVFISANYYFNTFYTIPFLLNKKRYVLFGVMFLLGVTLTAVARVPVSMFVATHIFKIANPQFNYLSIFADSFINILFWVICILAAKGLMIG
jgi:two-component system LytT family sensor kinase